MQRAGEQITGTVPATRYSEAVPRYTSYPTAPHFHAGIGAETFRGWLQQTGSSDDVSLYVHIPFCDRLCWFCACHTKMTRRYEPVAAFLDALLSEIKTVGNVLDGNGRIRALHFGGGSPTMLRPEDVLRLGAALKDAFNFADDAEISVELDPNDMDDARFDAFAAIGMTRASLGVQDFDPKVQTAINREQTFEQTRGVVDGVRARGVHSVNLDLLYGLPHQTLESVADTIRQALTLSPDRIALFGYAHVPWFKKHQTMIDEAFLPGPEERFAQQQETARIIREAGYQTIGLDHFAKPDDPLAVAAREGRLFRNFQGYTEDACRTLIGLGPSSVSRLPQGYAQNTPATANYERIVSEGGLATARGIALSEEDQARAWVIERLMCDFAFSGEEAIRLFGECGRRIVSEARQADEEAGLVEDGGTFSLRDEARPLVRSTAALFDQYLKRGGARHSAAV
ncbi:oxygen-independent coproporphyrinogen III oxidase [Nitratireductor aquimarinus]|uniref:oxygen-independent coproporphyrinogen III oxidase n=1 Tax=Alphaproteobacteria TaxID=28211 RepID=UPI0019D3E049|nr:MULTISPECIES: oxygen-independent coproporphyrinogen III oxidase [Alphaproteobacteria]MBN7755697.1 oxygen-independent coproporphyrinogen III oxidase [Nitratireductor aquimarinus]MBY5998451.1 oxygen-independent coproporphyrinogen III oxidase [Tritonibacter mobilis]MBY6020483.1 oxygen-independent coproporphyrinogen III oxidase [Nitratireductor sp. DP7N14-4]